MSEELEGGVEVQAIVRLHPDNPQIALLETRIWPIPVQITEELAECIRTAAHKWLTERGLTSPEITDIMNRGTLQ